MSETRTIQLPERFDYSSYRGFYDDCESALKDPKTREMVMNFRLTRYLDSAALGMLVQIHRKASEQNVTLKIANAQGIVEETLQIANMAKLYEFR